MSSKIGVLKGNDVRFKVISLFNSPYSLPYHSTLDGIKDERLENVQDLFW